MATDKARLRAWLNSREGGLFKAWLTERQSKAHELITKPSLDLAEPRNVYRVAQMQGECRLIKDLLNEDELISGLEKLHQSKETYGN